MVESRYPIEYELEPKALNKGTHWLAFKMKNIGRETLKKLDVGLHSTDTLYLIVHGEGDYIEDLDPGEEKRVITRVTISGSASIYATIIARKDGDYFWWDSPWMHITMTETKAELERFFVISEPYTLMGKTLEVEATVKGLEKCEGLRLEFMVYTPSNQFKELAKIEIKELSAGESAKYSTEFTTQEKGQHTGYAYLYDGWQRIGYKTDNIYVQS
jgi:hypothetical protein